MIGTCDVCRDVEPVSRCVDCGRWVCDGSCRQQCHDWQDYHDADAFWDEDES